MLRKPQLEVVARITEMVAAVAVVVSVIYLARQISDNTKLLRSQSHYNALMLGQRPMEFVIGNESMGAAVVQCDQSPDRVAAATWERCSNYYFMQFNAWEYFYYEHRDEAFPQEIWVGADAYYRKLLNERPGYVRFWSEMKLGFDEPFRSYAGSLIPRPAPVPADQRP
jgi:hypothetical protein